MKKMPNPNLERKKLATWTTARAGRAAEGGATLDERAVGPLPEEPGRPPRPRPAPRRQNKAARGTTAAAGGCSWVTCDRCSGRPGSTRAPGPGGTLRAGKMLRERTVRLQYGSRVEAVCVLGTQLWTDVYR